MAGKTMMRNFNVPVLHLDGTVDQEPEFEVTKDGTYAVNERGERKVVRMKAVSLKTALVRMCGSAPVDGEEKLKLYLLGAKIAQGAGPVTIDADDNALLWNTVKKYAAPLIVGITKHVLDTEPSGADVLPPVETQG